MSRGAFIQDASEALKEKVEMVKGSMDLSPEKLPAFILGMHMATEVFLRLTDSRVGSAAEYRIYPVEYVAIPDKEPVTYYDYRRINQPGDTTNDLLREIWEKVSS